MQYWKQRRPFLEEDVDHLIGMESRGLSVESSVASGCGWARGVFDRGREEGVDLEV